MPVKAWPALLSINLLLPISPPPPTPLAEVLRQAQVPHELWIAFTNLAHCESNFDPTAIGDGGLARGLYQIHWEFWRAAAARERRGYFTAQQWADPVANTRLALLIVERARENGAADIFYNWSVDPAWPSCQRWRLSSYEPFFPPGRQPRAHLSLWPGLLEPGDALGRYIRNHLLSIN